MAYWEGRFGGQNAGNVYLCVNVDLIGQDVANNFSTIRYNAWIERRSSTSVYNNSTTYGNTNINGYNPQRSLGSYNFGSTSRYNLAVNENYNIGHDSNGNANPYFGANYDLSNSPYLTTAGAGGNYQLPQINRYLNIDSWSLSNTTEKSTQVNVAVSNGSASAIDYQLNGGNWVNGYSGNTTSTSFTISGLIQATTYNVAIRVQNSAGGLYTYSATRSTTTNAALITNFTVNGYTDTSLALNVTTNYTSDSLSYKLNSSDPWTVLSTGDFTSTTQVINGLTSNTTYTVYVQARHKDSQTYTPTVSAQGTTSYPTPLQSSNLSPANGVAVSTLTPTLSWTFTSTSPDSQGSYEVIVYNRTSGAQLWDSGKVASTTSSAVIPGNILSFNVNYQWKVKTWSANNVAGSYTTLALFKTSQAPTTTILIPSLQQTFSSDTPVFQWTYTDPEGTAQTAINLDVQMISAPGQTTGVSVYKTNVSYTANTFSMPPDILQSGSRYIIKLATADSDGIYSATVTQEFLISFIGPPSPNISVETSEDVLFNKVTITTNAPQNDSYETDAVNVFKRVQGTTDWNQIGSITTTSKYIETYETTAGWSVTPTGGSVQTSSTAREGVNSLSLITDQWGTYTYTKSTSIGTIANYDKVRVWIRPTDIEIIGSLQFMFGANSTNYYSFTIQGPNLTVDVWNSIEVSFNALQVVGNPSISNIVWQGITLVAHTPYLPSGSYNISNYDHTRYSPDGNGNLVDNQDPATRVGPGVLLVDGLRVISSSASSFINDYDIANGKTYEYSASSFSAEQNLSSGKVISPDVITVNYEQFANTFLIPVGYETQSVIGFMPGDYTPSWVSNTDTQYYYPVGSKMPIVYTLDSQDYITGSIQLAFIDRRLDCKAIDSLGALETIKNYKPLLLRTWWGDNYYISIDGKITNSRRSTIGWNADFSFTEIGNGS